MTYAQAVVRGRFLLKRSEEDQWELAELTFDRTTGPRSVQLKVWAADIGMSESHASRLRSVWERFGQIVDRQSFNDCYTMVKVPRRAAELRRRAASSGRSVTAEERASRPRDRREAARGALLDEKQRRDLLADSKIRRLLERELGVRPGRTPRPGRPAGERGDDLGELTATRDRLYVMLDGMLDRRLSAKERKGVGELADDIVVAGQWMGSYARTGDRSFQDALDAVLAGREVEGEPARLARPRRPAPAPARVKPARPAEAPASTVQPRRRQRDERDRDETRGRRRAS